MSKPNIDYLLPRFGVPITDWWEYFAWRPVWTSDRGWVWLRKVWKRRCAAHDYISGDAWFQYAVGVTPKGERDE